MSNPVSKRLTAVEWATIVALYERGEKNTRELAEQFQVSRQAIEQGLRQRSVQRHARLEEVKGEVEDVAREEHRRRVAEAVKNKDDYKGYIGALTKLTMKRVIQAENANTLPGINADLVVLNNAMKIVAKGREQIWDILDIKDLTGDDEELPDLNIGEYSPEEIEGIKAANEDAYLEATAEDDDEAEE